MNMLRVRMYDPVGRSVLRKKRANVRCMMVFRNGGSMSQLGSSVFEEKVCKREVYDAFQERGKYEPLEGSVCVFEGKVRECKVYDAVQE